MLYATDSEFELIFYELLRLFAYIIDFIQLTDQIYVLVSKLYIY